MDFIDKFYVELLESIDYNAQVYLKTNIEALELLENIEEIGGFISRKDLRDILDIKEHKFKIIIDGLLKNKLIYLDKKYNSNILLTAKALSILKGVASGKCGIRTLRQINPLFPTGLVF